MENRCNDEAICLICVGFVCVCVCVYIYIYIYIKRGAIVPKSEAGDVCVGHEALRHS